MKLVEKGGRFPGERANLSARKVPGFSEKGLSIQGFSTVIGSRVCIAIIDNN